MDYPTWFDVIAVGSVAVVAFMLVPALFTPGIGDRAEGREMSYEEWRGRPLRERAHEQLGRLLGRRQ